MFNSRGRKQPVTGLETHAVTVEQILLGIGVDPEQARMHANEGYAWHFPRGSATIEVYVTQQDGSGYLQVLSPIVHLPENNLFPLYRHLLELNLKLTNASLGVYLDVIYVFSERALEGLDPIEANMIINLVATYADDLDDKLVGEFGGRLYGRI